MDRVIAVGSLSVLVTEVAGEAIPALVAMHLPRATVGVDA
jgi:hypothetical protein